MNVWQVKDNQKTLKDNIAAYFHKIRRDSPKCLTSPSEKMKA